MKSVYKIRDKYTGLFSKGGAYPRFGKIGKLWTSRGALKNHLSLAVNAYKESNRFEIVEYLFAEVEEKISISEEISRPAKK